MTALPPTCTWVLTVCSTTVSLAAIRHDRIAGRQNAATRPFCGSEGAAADALDHENPQVRGSTPPETRTRNPLVVRHMIRVVLRTAPTLFRGGITRFRSSLVTAHGMRFLAVSGDQSGNLIMSLP
jgi:hypothetical protein